MKCFKNFETEFPLKRSLVTATRKGVDNIKLDLQTRVVRIDEGCYFHATSVSQLWTASCDPHSRRLPATDNRQQAIGLQQKTAVTRRHVCNNSRQFREGAKVNGLPNGFVGKFVANCLPCSESFSANTLYAPVILVVIQVLAFFTEKTQTAVCQSVCNSAVSIPLQNILTTPGVWHPQPPITSGPGSLPKGKVVGS